RIRSQWHTDIGYWEVRFRLPLISAGQETANLPHRVIDLHVECALPQLRRRAARVTQDSALWTLPPALHLAIDDGISHCRGDQISPHPCVVLVKIHHLPGVLKVPVE